MAFFNKLREAAELAKNKIQEAVQTVNPSAAECGIGHPLADETVRKYYEIAYGLFASLEGGCVDFDGIKKYIEHCTGEVCNVEKLRKAVTYYGQGTSYKISTNEHILKFSLKNIVPELEINKIIEVNKELAQSLNYRCTKEKALEICYREYIEDVKSRFCEMLDILKEKPKKKFLDEGLDDLEWALDLSDDSSLRPLVTGKTIAEVMVERLLAGDSTVRTLVIEEVCEHIRKTQNLARAYAIVLRAGQFEKYGKNLEEYQTITEEDCRNAVMNSHTYQEQSSEESPFDKGSVYSRATREIMECKIMEGYSDLDWKCWATEDVRFVDAACYYALQKMATYYVNSDTTNAEKAVALVATYATSEN